ncbi:hypothetical protein CROQUDRAFT_97606 [Cronartium quercuum f. sp. fusiforme G11]|uniref:Uncharacterized protein n=1 Tax=Cronartium quercuum f. sp. fusiforme G11 TaxID=708437 RepID=A0A9P6NAI8_9BASI|nr:hypothetical protein CROQUDRAFT_97606 [Cronartium quercuum f. sp. fusiforme G11]
MFNTRVAVLTHPHFKTTGRRIADALEKLQKGQAASIIQLRTGNCPLNTYPFKVGRTDTNKCERRGVTESTTHCLVYCKLNIQQRKLFRKNLKKEKIRVTFYNAHALMDKPEAFPFLAKYVKDTGRFTHLKTYDMNKNWG